MLAVCDAPSAFIVGVLSAFMPDIVGSDTASQMVIVNLDTGECRFHQGGREPAFWKPLTRRLRRQLDTLVAQRQCTHRRRLRAVRGPPTLPADGVPAAADRAAPAVAAKAKVARAFRRFFISLIGRYRAYLHRDGAGAVQFDIDRFVSSARRTHRPVRPRRRRARCARCRGR